MVSILLMMTEEGTLPSLVKLGIFCVLAGQFDNHVWRLVLLYLQSKVMLPMSSIILSSSSSSSSSSYYGHVIGMILYVVTAIAIWYMPHLANLHKRPKEGCVFVTGCDSGMGQATVLGFAQTNNNNINNKQKQKQQGCYEQIFAGCYDKEAAEQYYDKALTKEQRRYVTVVALDVTKDDSVSQAVKTVQDWIKSNPTSKGLMGLVQYHGVAFNGPAAYMPMSMYQRQIEVNYVGSIRVVQAFLPLLKESAKTHQHNNRIVLTGTGGGPCSPCPPLLTAYMSSKFALEAYAQSLRQEMYMTQSNIDVCVINPGFVKPTLLMAEGLKLTETMWKVCEEKLGSTQAHDEYGPLMEHFLTYSSLQPGTHVSQVVIAADHALTSPVPRSSYKVGIDSKLAPIVGMMPTGMREWIARNGIYGVLSPAGTVQGYKV
ncbi:retinol dehydrogenase [Nitzschia inconspicua]|uniref:Retinol dehydrogenase n=1 Tax=Nitzschia inconspicua TaxID=303405 RepID=A0A9K3Q6M4_9STRA|nr:retinol dehydrogenase [Nitzschia inconspicua]